MFHMSGAQERNISLSSTQKALAIFDVFSAHRSRPVLDLLEKNNILVVFVPGGCTGELQPLDLSVNYEYKKLLKDCFRQWYANKVKVAMEAGTSVDEIFVDLRTSAMKPVHAR